MEREFVYTQAKGVLHFREGDAVQRIGRGYSGHPPYVNDPGAQALKGRGPIPRGAYRIGLPFDHHRLGPLAMYLEPHGSNDMNGRSGFFIHGDNALGDQSASHGCIILSRAQRLAISELLPKTRKLVVV